MRRSSCVAHSVRTCALTCRVPRSCIVVDPNRTFVQSRRVVVRVRTLLTDAEHSRGRGTTPRRLDWFELVRPHTRCESNQRDGDCEHEHPSQRGDRPKSRDVTAARQSRANLDGRGRIMKSRFEPSGQIQYSVRREGKRLHARNALHCEETRSVASPLLGRAGRRGSWERDTSRGKRGTTVRRKTRGSGFAKKTSEASPHTAQHVGATAPRWAAFIAPQTIEHRC
jgi:hypothetical protein